MELCKASPDGKLVLWGRDMGLRSGVLRVATPWKRLNAILSGGFYGGELIVVSGNGLSNTLSSFVRSLVLHALEEGTRTVYMNNRGATTSLFNQFILGRVPIDKSALWDTNKIPPALLPRVEEAREIAATFPVNLCRMPISIAQLGEMMQKGDVHGNAFFVIDPVSFVSPDKLFSLSEIVSHLKLIAVGCGVPILVSIESLKHEEVDHRLEDFPEAVLAHADKMITLKDDTVAGKMLHVAVIRNRDGELGSVVMSYDPVRFALVEGERVVPSHINEPVPSQRAKESEEEHRERRMAQFLALIDVVEKGASSKEERDSVIFIRERLLTSTNSEALEKMGALTGYSPTDKPKGSRLKSAFIKLAGNILLPAQLNLVKTVIEQHCAKKTQPCG